ncbi:predicted protein [Plenodomus lingam JN3]|uniref:Predicted protein n=1 Tax=Leptosphaeria maculans (strain JN3 / isolate v23.1.3 / race Av1-4-5-6-7-8) TaxID=985895 RepID=E4ZWB0_LEPMJ|nr:predicted protein [Plenodomus lingam JN3]CBX95886.1 predicted protein [Plenodomus lingam JN3]
MRLDLQRADNNSLDVGRGCANAGTLFVKRVPAFPGVAVAGAGAGVGVGVGVGAGVR